MHKHQIEIEYASIFVFIYLPQIEEDEELQRTKEKCKFNKNLEISFHSLQGINTQDYSQWDLNYNTK